MNRRYNMYNRLLIAILVTVFLPSIGFSKSDKFISDFVCFDRAYIPALFLTNMDKLNPSKKAMENLKTEWASFKGKYYYYEKDDTKWTKDFDKVEESIMLADKIISSGNKLIEAHEILENVRYTFLEMRKRNNIDYFIDYLTEFHDPMEHIVLRAKGKIPKTLKDNDIEFLEKSFPEAADKWNALKNAGFNNDIFHFNDERLTNMKDVIIAETKAMDALKSALNNKSDKANLIKNAVGIKKNFVLLFELFGDFKGLE